MIRAGNLIKQGVCKKCKIAIFGYSEKRKFLCGECSGNKGNYPRKINDYVTIIEPLSDERKETIQQNQLDILKNEVLFWKAKYDNLKNLID
tara:strand:+ start:68 stop:340 length:273 start_codon:yes stop_codon:yes gene_type:complete